LANAGLFCPPSTLLTHCCIQNITFSPNISTEHCGKNVLSKRSPSYLKRKYVTLGTVHVAQRFWHILQTTASVSLRLTLKRQDLVYKTSSYSMKQYKANTYKCDKVSIIKHYIGN